MSQPLIAISRKQALWFACFLVMYEFFTYIANDMIMPGMIGVVKSFNAPESMVATSLTIYILGGASLQVILGPLSDALGRRPLMLTGAALFFLFTLWITCAQSMDQFLVARFFQGMGLCFIGVIGYATIQEIFAEMDAIRIIAIMANASILAPLLGPLVGAVIIHYASWRWIFAMIAVGALVSLWGLWRFMPEPIGQVKTNGQLIPRVPLSFRTVFANFKALMINPSYVYSTLAIGILNGPCLAWIALSPIILVSEAKLSVIEYGLWQIPVFGATIIGNWVLHRLSYKLNIKEIILLGATIQTIGLSLCALLPFVFGLHFTYLMPGIIIYFFSLSITNAPLTRLCLFVTDVSKGTASAIESLANMLIIAVSIEIVSACYKTHNNLNFALYCLASGCIFLLLMALLFWHGKPKMVDAALDT